MNATEFKILKAPFPWMGGKSRVAAQVWARFGDVANYVEPFAGSLAVLLGRPTAPRIETVNDIDCYIANFWRALAAEPDKVAKWADWPVNEADLHARHRWLHSRELFRYRMDNEADFFDAKVAGWWVWGISAWIGDNWCRVKTKQSLPNMGHGNNGGGIHRAEYFDEKKRPSMGGRNQGRGVHANHHVGIEHGEENPHGKRPRLTGFAETGVRAKKNQTHLQDYFESLSARLRQVRVCCGDWARVCTDAVTIGNGLTGVMLDPPYGVEDRDKVYNFDSLTVSSDVRAWAVANGNNPLMRIALCGYEGEHAMPPDWECMAWKANGGYGNRNKENQNGHRERIWFSPHCIKPSDNLFFTTEGTEDTEELLEEKA